MDKLKVCVSLIKHDGMLTKSTCGPHGGGASIESSSDNNSLRHGFLNVSLSNTIFSCDNSFENLTLLQHAVKEVDRSSVYIMPNKGVI